MRKVVALLLALGTAGILTGQTNDKASSGTTTSKDAKEAPVHEAAVDTHEGMTIGVAPWTDSSQYKHSFPKKSPYSAGIVAVHLRFKNDNDKGVRVDLKRIRLVVQVTEDNRQELQALSAEDVADTIYLKESTKDPTIRRVPLPLPVGSVKPERDAKWTSMRDACQNAAVPTSIVGGHATVQGLIYFDLRGEMDLLKTARLYVPDLTNMSTNEPLSYFDIDLGNGSEN